MPEAEIGAADDPPCPERPQQLVRKDIRRRRGELGRELDHDGFVEPDLRQQLQPPLERRQQLDLVAEDGPWVRVERQDRGTQAGVTRRLEHAAVAAVDAVEGADRDRALGRVQLADVADDPHAPAPIRASAASGVTSFWSSASATENGPTSVRRSDAQWPPSASAIERT